MGYYDTEGPECRDDNVSSASTCICTKLWDSSINEKFTWDGSDYRVMHFGSAEWLQPPTRTYMLLLKVSFSCKFLKNAPPNTRTIVGKTDTQQSTPVKPSAEETTTQYRAPVSTSPYTTKQSPSTMHCSRTRPD
jgi:hypothetical protein